MCVLRMTRVYPVDQLAGHMRRYTCTCSKQTPHTQTIQKWTSIPLRRRTSTPTLSANHSRSMSHSTIMLIRSQCNYRLSLSATGTAVLVYLSWSLIPTKKKYLPQDHSILVTSKIFGGSWNSSTLRGKQVEGNNIMLCHNIYPLIKILEDEVYVYYIYCANRRPWHSM